MSNDNLKYPPSGSCCDGRMKFSCDTRFIGWNPTVSRTVPKDFKKCFGSCHNLISESKPIKFLCFRCYNASNQCSICTLSDEDESQSIDGSKRPGSQLGLITVPSVRYDQENRENEGMYEDHVDFAEGGEHDAEEHRGSQDSQAHLTENDLMSPQDDHSQESQPLSQAHSSASQSQTSISTPTSDVKSTGSKKREAVSSKYANCYRFVDDPGGDPKKRRVECTCCSWGQNHPAGNSTKNLSIHRENCKGRTSEAQGFGVQMIIPMGSQNFLAPVFYSESALRRSIAEWIVMDQLPFFKAEQPGFLKVLATARSDYKPVGRRTVQRDIMLKLYPAYRKAMMERFRHEIHNGTAFHATTDLWTCGLQHLGYAAVTLHYIEHETWTLVHVILKFEEMVIPHSGENIASVFYSALKEFGVHKRLFSAVLDNASTNNLAMELFQTKYSDDMLELPFDSDYLHGRCQCHILNLLNKICLDSCKSTLTNLRKHVLKIRTPKQWNLFNVYVKNNLPQVCEKIDSFSNCSFIVF